MKSRQAKPVCAAVGLLLGAMLLAGCGNGASSTAPLMTTGQFQTLQFSLTTSRAVFFRGENVPFTYTITNVGTQPVTVYTPGGPVQPSDPVEATVNQGDTLVWDKNYGISGIGVIRPISFAPGQSRRYTFTWPQKNQSGTQAPPGIYRVSAFAPVYVGKADTETKLAVAPMDITVQ